MRNFIVGDLAVPVDPNGEPKFNRITAVSANGEMVKVHWSNFWLYASCLRLYSPLDAIVTRVQRT